MTNAQRMLLERWLDELERWRGRVNLTTVSRDQAWTRHVDEALVIADALAGGGPSGASALRPARGGLLIDVGSGAGVPGIPLAVCRPDLRVTLLEADRRKAGFLVHVAGLLRLDNLEVVAARAEVLARGAGREHYDLAVSRATAPAAVLCELCLPLVRPGGLLLALVADAQADVDRCRTAAAACGGAVPIAVAPGLLRVDKLATTPPTLPRRVGVAARRPL